MTKEPLSLEQRREVMRRVQEALIGAAQKKESFDAVKSGVAVGVGLGGASLLGRLLHDSFSAPKSSYTIPSEVSVYYPDREKKKRRAKSAMFGGWRDLVGLDSKSSNSQLAQQGLMSTTNTALALAAGIPLGWMGSKAVADYLRQAARNQDLKSAQREFELALQEYASAGDEPKKIEKKSESPNSRSALVTKLAENLTEIAKTAEGPGLLKSIAGMLAAYVPLSALAAGVYGFSNQWDKRKALDLEMAERRVNRERESRNPTFTIATLKRPPQGDRFKEPNVEPDERKTDMEARKEIERALRDYNLNYL